MEKREPIDLDTLSEVAGGAASAEKFEFRIDVFRGDTYIDYVPCIGYPDLPAFSLSQCLRLQNEVSLSRIHIYLPSGIELNYRASFEENGICSGITLKGVITE